MQLGPGKRQLQLTILRRHILPRRRPLNPREALQMQSRKSRLAAELRALARMRQLVNRLNYSDCEYTATLEAAEWCWTREMSLEPPAGYAQPG